MSGHTPGKWSVEQTNGFVRNVCVTSDFLDIDRNTLACFGPVDNPWAQSNARLFAAAPELLTALRDLCDAIPEPTLAADPPLAAWEQIARAAIAKAEGRS